jgi:Rrf2 family protein
MRYKLLIAKKSLYAIRALLELVRISGQKPVNSGEIARKQGVSGRFIEVILNELKNTEFVESKRGSNGGYLLAKRPEDISVLDIISCMEGPISILSESEGDRKARYYGVDSMNALWTSLLSEINLTLEKKTLKDLDEEEKAAWDKSGYNYVI